MTLRLHLFSIRDIKSDSYNTPFLLNTTGQALRAFADLASDKNTTVGQHPEDYQLFIIGAFDPETGQLYPATPTLLGTATDFLHLNAVPIAPAKDN